jgi:hypothetical protein
MKNILTIFILFAVFTAKSQVWFEVGAKGSYGITALYNKNVWDDSRISNKFTTGFGVGGRLGINIGSTHGFALEVLTASGKQTWGYQLGTSATKVDFTTAWKSLDYYLLYRNSGNGGYFEIGPKYSTISSVKQTNNLVEKDVSDKFNKGLMGAAMGFGGNIAGGDVVALTFGLRFEYMFADFVNNDGKLVNQPIPPLQIGNSKTNIINIQAVLELNFGIGSYAKASCGNRRFVFSWNQ